jgi:peptide/nickel transport system ATP-binding protein/oligopeptide transport system ATP-binding protein
MMDIDRKILGNKVSNKKGDSLDEHLLEIRNLRTYFFTDVGVLKTLDGVDLYVKKKETLGLVGESGCGKTMTARSIMRLVPSPGRIVDGEIILNGRNLLTFSENEMRKIRGDEISMVFQEPMTSLNPVYQIGNQITETLAAHRPAITRKERKGRAVELLKIVGIPSPERRFYDYPYQLSGGMRQRVVIAMALACGNPELLIADEPTTALDVTIQAQILELFKKLQEEIGMSIILITHDLAVIAEVADRVAVMYAGSVVESTDVVTLFENPLHPYTRGLLNSLPQLAGKEKTSKLYTISGVVPNLLELRRGCKFFNRCSFAQEQVCMGKEPSLHEHEPGHWVRCVRIDEIENQKDKG